MGAISPLHLILILVVALLVLGPGKLPETGAALGRAIREFRDAVEGRGDDVSRSASGEPSPSGPAESTDGAVEPSDEIVKPPDETAGS